MSARTRTSATFPAAPPATALAATVGATSVRSRERRSGMLNGAADKPVDDDPTVLGVVPAITPEEVRLSNSGALGCCAAVTADGFCNASNRCNP